MPTIKDVVSDADVGGVATRAQQWTEFLSVHHAVAPGSSVAVDDAACPVLPCSRIAWGCLTHAHARLLATDGQDRATALEDAFVATSHAVTVLLDERPVRTVHALRIAWTVLDGRTLDPALAALGRGPNPAAVLELERLLAERGFDASPRWHVRSSVRTAGALVSTRVNDSETFETALRSLWADQLSEPRDMDAAEQAVATMWELAAQAWRRRTAAPELPPRSPFAGRARF